MPLFPVGRLLLAGEQMPLHIFEERYQQLFSEAEADDTRFGLPFRDKRLNLTLVSICRLVQTVKRFSSGERDVLIEASGVAVLDQHDRIFKGKLYPGGLVGRSLEPLGDSAPHHALLELFADYVELKTGKRARYEVLIRYKLGDIARQLALNNEEKVDYAVATSEQLRQQKVMGFLRMLNLLHRQERLVRGEKGVILN